MDKILAKKTCPIPTTLSMLWAILYAKVITVSEIDWRL